MIERANTTIENMLVSFVSDNQNDWNEHIYLLMLAYRSSEYQSIGVSPYEMSFAHPPTIPIDLILGKPKQNQPVQSYTEYVEHLHRKLCKIHEFARKNLKISDRMKIRYDHKSVSHQYKEGDLVWLYTPT
jgi:hypothetical protein